MPSPAEARTRVSVVLASFNGSQYIGAQLESILVQLREDDEIVVSDDASQDDTLRIVESFADPRVRVRRNEDRVGYVANFERALALARGEHVFFADQDDVWLPGKVATLLERLRGSACVATDARVVDERLQPLHPSYFELRKVQSFSPLSILLRPPIVGATVACRRAFLDSVLPFPRGVSHDTWIALNAALRKELSIVRQPLILYRRHANVVSLSALGRRRPLVYVLEERLRIVAALLYRRIGIVS